MAAVLMAAMLAAAAGAASAEPRVVGPAETAIDMPGDGCGRWDIPDTPARAWREAGGVALLAGSEASRVSRGPDLGRLVRDCGVVHRGAGDDDPGAYDDRAWVHSTWADGARVTALAHVEYHGHLRPGRCAAGAYLPCWRNAIVELRSEDGGRSFRRVGLVAALPYRYAGEAGERSGYFNPSNILARDGYLYAFVMAEATGAQRRGPCLIRRPLAGGPGDWRAWDGAGFGGRFADPYREDVPDPARHVCAPVAGLRSTVSGVVAAPGRGFLAVTAMTGADGVSGVYWARSDDLVTWSPPALLWAAPLMWRRDCAAPAAFAYPSLIDADSPSPNFETVDGRFWLYVVRMPLGPDCGVGPERDLMRMPVSWPVSWPGP